VVLSVASSSFAGFVVISGCFMYSEVDAFGFQYMISTRHRERASVETAKHRANFSDYDSP
jgi:hypothetical protein